MRRLLKALIANSGVTGMEKARFRTSKMEESVMRAFEYDAFVSHNSFDEAKGLMEELQKQGVRLFCDEAIDLSDRQVQARVQQALMKSRCVVVHVPSSFRDSGWCRAEYGSALRCSEEAKVQRVVVARRTLDAPVPASLAAVPVFDLPDAICSLSEFLVESNRIPAGIEAEVEAQRTGSYGTPLGTRQDLMERSTRMLEIVSALRVSVEREEAVSSEVLQRVVSRARYFIDAADGDTRTNAHRALILTAALAPELNLAQEIRTYICREMYDAVLVEVLHLYFYVRLSAEPHDIWLAAALLRATSSVRTLTTQHEFLNTLPESVWCRVVQGRLDLRPLDVIERAILLEERLTALLKRDEQDSLEPFEIEGSLRELLPFLEPNDDENTKRLRGYYQTLVCKTLQWAERRGHEPIRKMGVYACDVLVEPLARLMTEGDTSPDLFEWACQVVEENTTDKNLVNQLRVMGHLVRTGMSWLDAKKQTMRTCLREGGS